MQNSIFSFDKIAYTMTLVGVKGRIQSRNIELEDETKKQIVEVVAEKVTFLSSKHSEEAE